MYRQNNSDNYHNRFDPQKNWYKKYAWFPKFIRYEGNMSIIWLEYYEYTKINKDEYEYRTIKERQW